MVVYTHTPFDRRYNVRGRSKRPIHRPLCVRAALWIASRHSGWELYIFTAPNGRGWEKSWCYDSFAKCWGFLTRRASTKRRQSVKRLTMWGLLFNRDRPPSSWVLFCPLNSRSIASFTPCASSILQSSRHKCFFPSLFRIVIVDPPYLFHWKYTQPDLLFKGATTYKRCVFFYIGWLLPTVLWLEDACFSRVSFIFRKSFGPGRQHFRFQPFSISLPSTTMRIKINIGRSSV